MMPIELIVWLGVGYEVAKITPRQFRLQLPDFAGR